MENITSYINRKINNILGRNLIENVIIGSIIVTEQVNQSLNKEGLILLESKDVFSPVPGVKHYSYRIDKQQGDGGPGRQRHIHLYYNGEELFAMNVDATAHDGYHQVEIPRELNPFLCSKGFPIPANNIIEIRQYNSMGQLLCEDVVNGAMINDKEFSAALENIQRITIVESNVKESEVTMLLKIRNNYQRVFKLVDVPQDRIIEVKRALIDLLRPTGKYADDVNDISDGYFTPESLYVAYLES